MVDPIEKKHRSLMNGVASALDHAFNPDGKSSVVFTLFIAEAGKMEGGRVNYISNGSRDDMVAMVREWLNRVDGRGAHAPSTATKQ
ncbi:hypothetical protein FHS96_004958 [Sphingomonas zeicaulis]|uniref:hypothetical protein n=1 Tax=Sphingomonas zeicaulis TaxID=1632740 RepID=UPI003D19D4FF